MTETIPGEDWERFTAQQRQQFQNGASMETPHTPNFPYRLAVEIQEHVIRMARDEEFHPGREDRDQWAKEYTLNLIDQNAVSPEYVAWQGLQVWRATYGARML